MHHSSHSCTCKSRVTGLLQMTRRCKPTVFTPRTNMINSSFYPETAGRTLEDIDDYYRNSPPLLVFRDKDVTSSKRPVKYEMREEEEVRRNSSVDPIALRRGSRVKGSFHRDPYDANDDMMHGEKDVTEHGHTERL